MSKEVDFIFDCASPNAYLCHKVIPDLEQRTGAQFNYIPCLLGGIFKATGNQAPMIAFGNIAGKLAYDSLEMRRFIERHGLDKFQMNSNFPIITLQVMRGAISAKRDGYLLPYVDVVLKAMWEDDQKMDDPEVIKRVFSDAGLDAGKLMADMQDPEVKAALIANTEGAVARGTFGIPTFYVGDDMFFGKERLGQVEELLTS